MEKREGGPQPDWGTALSDGRGNVDFQKVLVKYVRKIISSIGILLVILS